MKMMEISDRFITVVSRAPSSKAEIIRDCTTEPTHAELRKIWDDLELKDYGSCSDLIEVYEFNQLKEAFGVNDAEEIVIGGILTPNPLSTVDAVNAYYP